MANSNQLPVNAKGLWEGCILALCVHAVMLPEFPFILNEHIWADGIYMTQDNEGAKAALVFSEENLPLIGMFREFDSKRTELVLSEQYAASFYKYASEKQKSLARAMFPLFEEETGERKLPVVTSGFWLEDEKICSRDSYEEWYENGGEVLERQMQPFEDAMAFYEDYYGIDTIRMELIERIYKERILSTNQSVLINSKEIEAIMVNGPYNKKVCEETFNRLLVFFEK